MKTKFLVISSGILILASACNNSSESKETAADTTTSAVVTDTAAKVAETPPAAPVIDSAAVTREYLAAQQKTKKTAPPKPKKQGNNEVEIYSTEPIPSHEALEQPVPDKATPREAQVIHTKEYVYFSPAEKATFPGGNAKFAEFIKKTMVYPDDAVRYHVEGTVFADVYLDSLGHVTNVEFPATHLGSGLEEETHRVLMQSPRWMPAREDGKPVSSKITLPIVYKIDK